MITLTPAALQAAKRLLANAATPNRGLRVGIKGGGCSGMTYVLTVDEATPKPYDTVLEQEGLTILIDAKSHLALDGTTIDYTTNLMGGGFAFHNPLAKKTCGCGTSFTT